MSKVGRGIEIWMMRLSHRAKVCMSHGHQSSACSRCAASPEEIKQVLASYAWPQDEGYGLWDQLFMLTSPYRLQEVGLGQGP